MYKHGAQVCGAVRGVSIGKPSCAGKNLFFDSCKFYGVLDFCKLPGIPERPESKCRYIREVYGSKFGFGKTCLGSSVIPEGRFIEASDEHSLKAPSPSFVTPDGKTMFSSEEHFQKASFIISVRALPSSKITVLRLVQPAKA